MNSSAPGLSASPQGKPSADEHPSLSSQPPSQPLNSPLVPTARAPDDDETNARRPDSDQPASVSITSKKPITAMSSEEMKERVVELDELMRGFTDEAGHGSGKGKGKGKAVAKDPAGLITLFRERFEIAETLGGFKVAGSTSAPLASLSINSLPRPTKLKVEKAQVEKAQVEKSKVPESSRSYTASVTKGDSRAEKIKKPSAARPSLEEPAAVLSSQKGSDVGPSRDVSHSIAPSPAVASSSNLSVPETEDREKPAVGLEEETPAAHKAKWITMLAVKKFRCRACGRDYNSKNWQPHITGKVHLAAVAKEEGTAAVSCDKCNTFTGTTEEQLKVHQLKSHKNAKLCRVGCGGGNKSYLTSGPHWKSKMHLAAVEAAKPRSRTARELAFDNAGPGFAGPFTWGPRKLPTTPGSRVWPELAGAPSELAIPSVPVKSVEFISGESFTSAERTQIMFSSLYPTALLGKGVVRTAAVHVIQCAMVESGVVAGYKWSQQPSSARKAFVSWLRTKGKEAPAVWTPLVQDCVLSLVGGKVSHSYDMRVSAESAGAGVEDVEETFGDMSDSEDSEVEEDSDVDEDDVPLVVSAKRERKTSSASTSSSSSGGISAGAASSRSTVPTAETGSANDGDDSFASEEEPARKRAKSNASTGAAVGACEKRKFPRILSDSADSDSDDDVPLANRRRTV